MKPANKQQFQNQRITAWVYGFCHEPGEIARRITGVCVELPRKSNGWAWVIQQDPDDDGNETVHSRLVHLHSSNATVCTRVKS